VPPLRAIPCCLLLSVVLATLGVAAPADDLGALRAWQGREVTRLELPGLPEDLLGEARAGLALSPRRKLLRVERARLRLPAAEADARRLRLLLARHGYPAARIEAAAEADGESGVAVVFRVATGAAVTYGRISASGLPAAATAQVDSLRQRLPAGARFDETAVERARAALELAVRRAGHVGPTLTVAVTRAGADRADLHFACRPGPRYRYADLAVEGAPADLEPLARRAVALRPGTPYHPRVVAQARRNLRELQLFRRVRLSSEARADTALTLVATLAPRRMLTLSSSVGSFTDDWFVARAGASHRNLLRGGRGGALDLTYTLHRRRAETRLWWPSLLARRSRSELSLHGEIEDEDSYRLDTVGAEISTLYRLGDLSSLRLGVELSRGWLDDRTADPTAFQAEVGLLSVLSAVWYRDSSDDPVDPRRGGRTTLRAEWSPPGAWTDTPFASLQLAASRYLPLGGERVLALRLDGALGLPLGEAPDLRPDRRWFAGGVSTMRGYGRRELGPRDAEGQPLGGEARLLAGAELRLPLRGMFGLAAFLDGGQVWADRAEVDLAELASAAGLGLLLRTPIGPLRLDAARNLASPPDGVSRWRLGFAIGHPF
jgi:outer membrane protein assembly factor BamA